MIINISYDSSVNSAPAGFKTAINSVVAFFDSTFKDAVTVTIDVGYGEIDNQTMNPGSLGQSLTYLNRYTYSQIKSAMTADAKSADDASVVASLPASDPTGGHYWVAQAEAKALGLMTGIGLDGYVGFSSTANFDYDNSNGVTGYDFYGVVAHEISEVMGRAMLVGRAIGTTTNSYEPMDLLHFSAPGVHSFVGSQAGYFSLNNGVTNLDNFNTNSGGDPGDWASTAGNDAFRAFSSSGVVNAVTPTDLRVMDAIGWDVATVSLPDLTIGNLVLNLTNVSYNVNNIGTGTAGASTTGIYLSTDGSITPSDILLASVATPSLGAGGTDHESVSVVFPDSLAPGTYYVGAYADSGGHVTESSETNNASNAVPVILGNSADNVLTGTSANDTMFGFGGNDTLNGGLGADTMVGGPGDDTYYVDNVLDVVIENPNEGTDTVKTTLAAYVLPDNVENLTYTGTGSFAGTGNALANIINGGPGADVLTGGAGNDKLYGQGGNDTLIGGDGNDTLNGGTGADTMIGGTGNDTYYVDNALDVVIENPGEGTDTVNTTLASYVLPANVEKLDYTGTGNFTGTGNALANTITGGPGNDVLNGGDGNDTLRGGAGVDTLNGGNGNDRLNGGAGYDVMTGGAGADCFVFTPNDLKTGPAVGEIKDFSHSQLDLIDVSAIDAIAGGANDPFTFIGANSFSGVAGQLHYVANGSGGVNVQGDTNGDRVADFTIVLDGVTSLVAPDFIL